MVNVKRVIEFDECDYSGVIEEPAICPQCKHAIKPEVTGFNSFADEEDKCFLSVSYLCRNCFRSFIALHALELDEKNEVFEARLLYSEPNRAKEREFERQIIDFSPNFVRIYNQALAAETHGLDEICGMGYRKALEFLIKDYLISREPEKADSIRNMELGNCIANKIAENNIKTVASRCSWLGNDHSHYVVKFSEKDLTDLKMLLDATVYWIMMTLVTEEALRIEKR